MDKLQKNTNSLTIWKESPKQYLEEVRKEASLIDAQIAIKAERPHVSAMIKKYGETDVKAVLVLMVIDHVKFFNIGKTMNESQVVETVKLMIQNYSGYKLEDFIACFNNRKLGKYGKLYDVMDGSVILQDLALYDSERMAIIEQQHNQNKFTDNTPFAQFMPEDIKEEFDKIVPPFKPSLEMRGYEQSQFDKLANEIYREFDKLHREQKRNDGSVRMIEYEGQVMDIYTFISKKLEL